METRRKYATRLAGTTVLAAAFIVAASSVSGAVAIPGDPTPAECAVITQQAIDKGVPFATELANQGGGNCPIPPTATTTSTTVVVLGVTVVNPTTASTSKTASTLATVVKGGTLPRSGDDAGRTLLAGGIFVAIGSSLILINRRRHPPAE